MFKDKNGKVRAGPLVAAVIILAWAGLAFADTYDQTGILNLMLSRTNGAVSSPLFNTRPVSSDISNLVDGDVWTTTATNDRRWQLNRQTYGTTKVLTTNVTLSDLLTNPTANTTFSNGTQLIENDTLVAGKRLRIRASGKYTSGLAGNANLVFLIAFSPSGTVYATTGNVSTTTGADKCWDVQSEFQVYTAGASGTGYNRITGTCQNALLVDAVKVGRATAAFDTTVDNTVSLLTKFSASDATNTIKLEDFAVEVLN